LNLIRAGGQFDRAEGFKMAGEKLCIEQGETANAQPRDQRRQRDFRGVADPGEHRFAEEGAAQPHTI
jgi:hypothetical protein